MCIIWCVVVVFVLANQVRIVFFIVLILVDDFLGLEDFVVFVFGSGEEFIFMGNGK